MKQLRENQTIPVGQLVSRIVSRRTTADRFSFDCSQAQAEQLLTACYQGEVKARGRHCVIDAPTEDNIRRLAAWLTDKNDPRFGVMFCGGVGNGKTTMLNALADAIEFMSEDEGVEQQRILHTLYIKDANQVNITDASTIMLGIDDLGTEPVEVQNFGNISTPIIDLLSRRYQLRYFTAITTNLAPGDFRKRYGGRVADRFNEMFFTIGFTHDTYRSTVHVDKYRTKYGE